MFPTAEEYQEFTVNHLVMWRNIMDYKLFNTLYMTHQNYSHTVKNLQKQAMALLEEANRINDWDILTQQEIESHVQMITRSNLRQWIKKPQRVQVVVSPTPLPGPSRQPDNSHQATYG
jgi:hypothetical protein